jgi:hypothetical protein
MSAGLEIPDEEEEESTSEAILAALRDKLNKEIKIKEGSENMLEALNMKKAKQTKGQRNRIEKELNTSNERIGLLKIQIEELQRPKLTTSSRNRNSALLKGGVPRSPQGLSNAASSEYVAQSSDGEETESPTFALAEILQSLEVESMQPDYYVERANSLVSLLKRHPTLKYDLVWSVFGLRMQVMLLSESREVVAAGYRVTRHAITDLESLQKIRTLNTDYLVILYVVSFAFKHAIANIGIDHLPGKGRLQSSVSKL